MNWPCLSFCPVGSTREPQEGFEENLMWRLYYSARSQNCNLEWPAIGYKITNEESNEVDIEVPRSCSQSGKYRRRCTLRKTRVYVTHFPSLFKLCSGISV